MVKHTRKDHLDRFYTTRDAVDICLAHLDTSQYDTVVEPSAGDGAFSSRITHPNLIALDIHPGAEGIIQTDFLAFDSSELGKTLVVGNPPYGVNGRLVTAFIKKSCTFAHTVAFILPLSYKRESMYPRWPKHYHLVSEEILPSPNATLHGKLTSTRNIWMVWEYRKELRVTRPLPIAIGWRRVPANEADVAIRTVGRLGAVSDPDKANKTAHIFVKFDRPVDPDVLHEYLTNWPWDDYNMAQPSIGTRDFVPAINKYVGSS